MDQGYPAALVKVRMRVFIRRGAVRGPAGVADAERTLDRLRLGQSGEAFLDLALAFAQVQFVLRQEADGGAVVAAILKPA